METDEHTAIDSRQRQCGSTHEELFVLIGLVCAALGEALDDGDCFLEFRGGHGGLWDALLDGCPGRAKTRLETDGAHKRKRLSGSPDIDGRHCILSSHSMHINDLEVLHILIASSKWHVLQACSLDCTAPACWQVFRMRRPRATLWR